MSTINYIFKTGWNLCSFPMVGSAVNISIIDDILSAHNVSIHRIITEGKAGIKVGDSWAGSLYEIDPRAGYWINLTALPGGVSSLRVNVDFTVTGLPLAYPETPLEYTLHPGKNLISYSKPGDTLFPDSFIGNTGSCSPFNSAWGPGLDGITIATSCTSEWVGSMASNPIPAGASIWLENGSSGNVTTTLWGDWTSCSNGISADEWGPPTTVMDYPQGMDQRFIFANYPYEEGNDIRDQGGTTLQLGTPSDVGTDSHSWIGNFRYTSGWGKPWGDWRCLGSYPLCTPFYDWNWPNTPVQNPPNPLSWGWALLCPLMLGSTLNRWDDEGDDTAQMRWIAYDSNCGSYF